MRLRQILELQVRKDSQEVLETLGQQVQPEIQDPPDPVDLLDLELRVGLEKLDHKDGPDLLDHKDPSEQSEITDPKDLQELQDLQA
jgi:hypothetical protein